ncbi:MAG: inositol monophosphatase family protein [bacterium]|nr:inositol monophosphatase family protein [bacterium]
MRKQVVTQKMRQAIRSLALQMGKIQMRGLGKLHRVRFKGEINPVTEIDERCERLFVREIRKKFPTHSILGEESGRHDFESDYRWIVDPLDGTVNYSHAYPLFCVSIGLTYRGEIVLGVVYEPNLDEFFFAEKGKGARLNGKRIHVSKTAPLKKALLATGFAYNVGKKADSSVKQFRDFVLHAQAVRRDGVAAVDLAYVACGRFDGFWELGLEPWDIAAGILLVKEAGGKVSHFNKSLVQLDSKEILASNGHIHQDMIQVLKKV